MHSKKIFYIAMLILLVTAASALLQSGKETSYDNEINHISHSTVATKTNSIASFFEIASADEMSEDTELTVYNQNIALVKDKRNIDLRTGINLVEFVDVASGIDATSVTFEDTENPDTFVIEQNYQYDLVSSSKLLDKYLDEEIIVTDMEGITYSGKLLSHSENIVLKTNDGIVTLSEVSKIEYPDAAGLLTKPTLVWQVYSSVDGERDVLTTYLTDGINWKANYIVKINEDDTEANLDGWVTVDNKAGTTFENAKLKLVAGDINQVSQASYKIYDGYESMEVETFAGFFADLSVAEESLFDYHLYTLERTTTLNNNEVKQIALLSSDEIPVKKKYLYENEDKIKVILEINNSEENDLGTPLPKGVVRVYKSDSQGQLQFLGEDEIDHTPKDEEVEILVGNAFDITGDRRQSYYKRTGDTSEKRTFVIELKNHKEESVEINVIETFRGDWEILSSSDSFTEIDSSTIEFKVKVPADGEKKITYSVETEY
ncbi:DUF4139 domain-containing protein [Methanolobus profundi]|nr:DUF4139 domain-containing protein [Methanolobus profundi]